MEWKKTEEELPPHDGIYFIAYKKTFKNLKLSFYDGFSFIYSGSTKTPKFWAQFERFERKYGKIK